MIFSEICTKIPLDEYAFVMKNFTLSGDEDTRLFGALYEELRGANNDINSFLDLNKKNTFDPELNTQCSPVRIVFLLGTNQIQIMNSMQPMELIGKNEKTLFFSNGVSLHKFEMRDIRHVFIVDTLCFREQDDAAKFIVMVKLKFAGSKIDVDAV